MNKSTIKNTVKIASEFVERNASTILTVAGSATFVATVFLAIDETPKAIKLHEELNATKENPNLMDKVLVTGKAYWPTIVTGALSLTCFITANHISVQKGIALASAYSIAEENLKDYKEKVRELFGDKKAETVKDEIAKDKVTNNAPIESNVILTGFGDSWFYESFTGRYFKSSREKINQAVNEVNRTMMLDMYVTLNDLYYALGLPEAKVGDELGFNVDKGLIEIDFSSQLMPNGEPCGVMEFRLPPVQDFHAWY